MAVLPTADVQCQDLNHEMPMSKGPKPYKFIGFGDIHGPKPYKFIGFGDIRQYAEGDDFRPDPEKHMNL